MQAEQNTDMLKVLHSYKIYRPDVDGGIPYVIATMSQASDVASEILAARDFGLARRYQVEGIPVQAVSSLGTFFSTPLAPFYPFALHRRAASADVVVHHAPFPLTDLALRYPLPRRTALIVYWHADIVGYSLLRKIVSPSILRTLRRADRIIVADRSTIDNSPFLPSFAGKCVVVPYGADISYWSARSADDDAAADKLRQRYPRMILAIGRLVNYKGFNVLLQAMRGLDAQAVIIGEGPRGPDLERFASENGISDRVTFVGRTSREDIKTYINAARVLAFPSVTAAEAFGIVQLEAMAAGLPIVNTALATGVPNIARHEQEALTVPPNDAAALAIALRRILDDPALAQRLGQAGRNRALTQYSEETFLSRIKLVYQDAVQARLAQQTQDGSGQ